MLSRASLYLALGLLAAPVANAVLIDLGNVTRDTEQGLDWLDLPETQGLSFDDVLADAGGFASAGWRHARAGEICTLFENVVAFSACPGAASKTPGPAVVPLIELLGATLETPYEIEAGGWFKRRGSKLGIAYMNYQMVSALPDTSWADVFDAAPFTRASRSEIVANFLVRPYDTSADASGSPAAPVPEPASAWLVAAGLCGLAAGRSRRRVGA